MGFGAVGEEQELGREGDFILCVVTDAGVQSNYNFSFLSILFV